ncbi:YraN family protein [Flavobacteriales bacterium]|nr:YraN family protein [Flavobacteriales bacterium]
MAQHNETGKEGEEMAAMFLIKNGYSILSRNFRYKKSEIDIIVQKDKTVAFVEVKTRSNAFFQVPELSVTRSKQKQITKGADFYIQENDIDLDIRFDILAITLSPYRINHIEDAFYPLV